MHVKFIFSSILKMHLTFYGQHDNPLKFHFFRITGKCQWHRKLSPKICTNNLKEKSQSPMHFSKAVFDHHNNY